MKRQLIASLALALTAQAGFAATVYQETFTGHLGAGDEAVTGYGWLADKGGAGNRTYAQPAAPDAAVWGWEATAMTTAFYTTEFTAIDQTGYSALGFDVDFYGNWQPANVTSRVAVEVGGLWYASNATFATATAVWTTDTIAFNSAAANWTLIDITGTGSTGANLTIAGAPAGDLTGNITGAGVVLTTAGDGETNFDNFTITGTAVPEPSTYALLAGAAALGFVALRRRRA